PNLPEAEVLAGMRVAEPEDMEEAARRIHTMGPRYVLVKGGHLKGDAIRSAKAYVTRAIREGFQAGRGVGQLRHFIPDW
ncbi:MAG: hydroxymethylpyrimidine/phosphomethylpyrimidine kinase, partial [Actinomycetota bacterium]|nr:hydroxymethylpyrimidine/phosphomethylpyrimidine kinase [Actinomycetota bacterium]